MNLARLPGWPRLLRATLAARYVDMTGAQANAIEHNHPAPRRWWQFWRAGLKGE